MIWGIIVILALLDQGIKEWILANIARGDRWPIVGEWLSIRLAFNSGAAFSLGSSATWLFTLIKTVVLIGILVFSFRVNTVWVGIVLGLVGGGTLGNLIDRLIRPPGFFFGHVVDYISVSRFAVFNFADACLTIGIAIYVVRSLLAERSAQ
ncbi:signal peptidase II [Corynebacterium sp. ES2715-CONJ3]|uniref:signal peptidase II n=1 Tax=Corynebacterium sp. ES2715-CONJ3 TaxID=2974028 RepID=UPI0021681584|nr:signal peptidase II [Corynebacterium sp. ES2715-CONJ3]